MPSPSASSLHRNDERLTQALAAHKTGDLAEAERLYLELLDEARPQPRILQNLSVLNFQRRDLDGAERWAREALKIAPKAANAWNNLAIALKGQGRLDEAVEALKKCVAADPKHHEAWSNLADLLRRAGRLNQAVSAVDRCLALKPGYPPAIEIGLYIKLEICDWRGLDELLQSASELVRRGVPFNPYSLIFVCLDPSELRQCAQNCAAKVTAGVRDLPVFAPASDGAGAGQRVRVGYLSSQFRAHATAYLIQQLLEAHDAERFEVFGYDYSNAAADDRVAEKIRETFHVHRDISKLSTAEAVEQIRDDKIDILIDVNGYADGGRSEIAAARVAPVQAAWLGYVGTTGAPNMDYILLDETMVPQGSEAACSERIVRLPGSFFPSDGRRHVDGSYGDRSAFGLPSEGPILAAFNQSRKLNPMILDVWAQILRESQDAHLWLWEQNRTATDNLRRAFSERGVASKRILATPSLPSPIHLARYQHATLYLDAFPCNGHTMMSDALYMGTPSVTWAGPTLPARVGASLLSAIGCRELIAATREEYVQIALRLIGDEAWRAEVRSKLTAEGPRRQVFDGAVFARKLEKAFAAMLDDARAGD